VSTVSTCTQLLEHILGIIPFTDDPNCTGISLSLLISSFLSVHATAWYYLFIYSGDYLIKQKFLFLDVFLQFFRRWAYGPQPFTVTSVSSFSMIFSCLGFYNRSTAHNDYAECVAVSTEHSPIFECTDPPIVSINFKYE
jgi:hypothetical protein